LKVPIGQTDQSAKEEARQTRLKSPCKADARTRRVREKRASTVEKANAYCPCTCREGIKVSQERREGREKDHHRTKWQKKARSVIVDQRASEYC